MLLNNTYHFTSCWGGYFRKQNACRGKKPAVFSVEQESDLKHTSDSTKYVRMESLPEACQETQEDLQHFAASVFQ